MDFNFLQLFLLVNVFFMGALAVVGIQHAYAHFRPPPKPIEKNMPPAQTTRLPVAMKAHLLESAQADFEAILKHSAVELQDDLKATAQQLNTELQKLGSSVARSETERYQKMLENLRVDTETISAGAQAEIAKHQTELNSRLEQEVAAEKDRLIAAIDTGLADAVASFLIETMGHNVDIGAQQSYLISMLEEHKEELVKGIRG